MARIALVGDNSIEYISNLINIWLNGDCAVLIDKNIPSHTMTMMMKEANVVKCIMDKKVLLNRENDLDCPVKVDTFDSGSITDSILPKSIYEKFKDDYSDREAVIIYSSGTTGKAKGIILSHYAINTNADAIARYMNLNSSDCMYLAKSLTHSSTLTGELLVALKRKIKIAIAPLVVTPRYIIDKIKKYGVSVLCLNPTLLKLIAQEYSSNRLKYDISSLHTIYVSGAILSDKLYLQAHKAFDPINIFNVYGLSEAAPRVSAQTKQCCKSNSVGKPLENVQVCIVDESGAEVATGNRGIIHVKTPSIFCGYAVGKSKHKSLYKDWLNTGDIGFFDENEELHLVGRIDDVTIIDSHKIYPSDIESAIVNNTPIQSCSVVKVTIQNREILACLCEGKKLNEKEIISILKHKLLPYEIPKFYVFKEKIPINKNGKILKQQVTDIIYEELLLCTDST